MAKNLRALTLDELNYIKNNYVFELLGDYVVVSSKAIKRRTIHTAKDGFSISTKMRRINITPYAISLWELNYINKYSLIEVQNAINTLIVTYHSNINLEELTKQLEFSSEQLESL